MQLAKLLPQLIQMLELPSQQPQTRQEKLFSPVLKEMYKVLSQQVLMLAVQPTLQLQEMTQF
jgi:hypothetical protein